MLLILPFVVTSGIRTNTTPGDFASNALLQLTLTQAWVAPSALGWNSPGWSLSVEAFFYLLFPFLLPRLARLRTRTLVILSCGAFAVAQAVAVAGGLAPGAISRIDATNPPIAPWALFFSSLPLFRLPEFVIGMAAGIVFTRHGKALERHANALVAVSTAIILIAAGLLAPGIPVLHLNNGGLSLPAAALFIGLAAGSGWLARMLAHPWLVRLGEASYAVYILHYPIAIWLSRLIGQKAPELREMPLTLLAIQVAVVVLASLLAYMLVEEPMRKWIKARFAKRDTEAVPVVMPPDEVALKAR
jgi:peptidoglycan/LPS O-acetylase OafA/YrhL